MDSCYLDVGGVFRRQLAGHLRAGRRDEWRNDSLIYADWLEEHGQERQGQRRRRKVAIQRSPGLLWPRACRIPGLSDHQREVLCHTLTRPLCLLTGTPGTGKTYTTAGIIGQLVKRYGIGNTALCAPTGKAAVRLNETLDRLAPGLGVTARTIHQTLEIGRNGHDGEGWSFQRNTSNPLRQRFVVVDESSMLDTDLAASLFSACLPGTHVLLVGDPYQLPPVGHGAPLRDLIAAGVPCGQLTEIRRNTGLIVRACAAIKDGKPFEMSNRYAPEEGLNLRHFEADTPEKQVEILEAVLARFRSSGSFNPMTQVQVLVATNKGSLLSRKEINRRLQGLLNPDGERLEKHPFAQNDRVICLRNHWAERWDAEEAPTETEPEVYLANGEIGSVSAIAPGLTFAAFGDDLVRIPTRKQKDEDTEDEDTGTGCDFDLAYGITCHKSQGSEWPCVIVLIDPSGGAKWVCSREWVYTALSRASKLCITIGQRRILERMCRRPSLERRKTFLRELLTQVVD